MKKREDPVAILIANGVSTAKAKEIASKTEAWKIRKRVLERQLPRVKPWRCPVHGCLLEIKECLHCKIDTYRRIERLGRELRGNQ